MLVCIKIEKQKNLKKRLAEILKETKIKLVSSEQVEENDKIYYELVLEING